QIVDFFGVEPELSQHWPRIRTFRPRSTEHLTRSIAELDRNPHPAVVSLLDEHLPVSNVRVAQHLTDVSNCRCRHPPGKQFLCQLFFGKIPRLCDHQLLKLLHVRQPVRIRSESSAFDDFPQVEHFGESSELPVVSY